MKNIKLEKIQPNENQPRKHFEGIEELAENIKQHGLLTPILVRPIMSRDIFEIVNGERRFRACQLLEMETIRAEVKELDDDTAYMLALIENVQRDNLTPIEEAESYQRLILTGLTQEEMGEKIGKSQSYIASKLRMLKLPPGVRHFIAVGALSEGHGKQILKLKNIYPKNIGVRKKGRIEEEEQKSIFDDGGFPDVFFYHLKTIKPESEPPLFLIRTKTDSERLVIMTKAITEFLNESEDEIPQWIVSAHWWALMAYWHELSVAELSKLIDGWKERYYSALSWMNFRTPDAYFKSGLSDYAKESEDQCLEVGKFILSLPDSMSKKDQLIFGECLKDLACSNSLIDDVALPEDVFISQLHNGFTLPTALQMWGSRKTEYQALLEPF